MTLVTEKTTSTDALNTGYQELPLGTDSDAALMNNHDKRSQTKWNRLLQAELEDVKSYRFWRASLTEFYASIWLVVFLLGADCRRSDQEPPSRVLTALTIAFTVNMVVLTTFGLSGAQANPAITTMLTATGRNTVSRGLIYLVMQCLGGCCAVLIIKGILPKSMTKNLAVIKPAQDVTVLQAFWIEVFLGTIIGLATLSMLEKRRTDFWGSFPHGFGILMASNYFFASGVTPVCMNPTFSIGPMIVLMDSEYQWIYIFGPTTGLLLGGIMFDMFFSEDIADRWDKTFFKAEDEPYDIDRVGEKSLLEPLNKFRDTLNLNNEIKIKCSDYTEKN